MRCKNCNELYRDDLAACPYCTKESPYGSIVVSDKVKFWIQALTGSPILVDYYGTGRTALLRLIRSIKVLFIVFRLFSSAALPCIAIMYKIIKNSTDVNEGTLKVTGAVFGVLTFVLIGICIADFFLNRQTAMAVENMTWGRHNSACLKIPVIIWGVVSALLLACTLLVSRNFSGVAVFAVAMLLLQTVIMNLGNNARKNIEAYQKYTADTKE